MNYMQRIGWDFKWFIHLRRLIQHVNLFVFKFNSGDDNPMKVFKDYPHFFKFINRLYGIDNNIKYWIRNGTSYSIPEESKYGK